MDSTITGSPSLVPAAAHLDAWADHTWENGVLVTQLAAHDRITVRTRNSTYEIIVTVPHTAEVMVRGGAFFPDFTRARVTGSSLGGGFLKMHGLYVGFQLELLADGKSVVTTRLRTVDVTSPRAGAVM